MHGLQSIQMIIFLTVSTLSNALMIRSIGSHQIQCLFRRRMSADPGNVQLLDSKYVLEKSPYEDIFPFLTEHILPTDQMLFLGASSDLSLRLLKAGYGTKKTGLITVVDSDSSNIEALKQELSSLASNDNELKEHIRNNRFNIKHVNSFADMKSVCKQSSFDSIVDFGGLDSLLAIPNKSLGDEQFLKCIEHLQNALRLGNVLISLSKRGSDKERLCSLFDQKFGWIQELDGDPGEVSAWYRGKSNIEASNSNFKQLGLKMYVYTNADNC